MQPQTTLRTSETVADLLEQLGGIPARRVRLRPAVGTAREEDVVRVHDREGRLCELVDGVLVEKVMGFYESRVAAVLIYLIEHFLGSHPLGIVLAPDGMMRIAPGLVRIPDVSFVSWEHLPGGRVPRVPIPDVFPDLAVEVLSEGNTAAEMKRKVGEYFAAGARLVWLADPGTREVDVYTSPDRVTRVDVTATLDGGDLLPGFTLPVRDWFSRADPEAPRK